MSSILKPHVHAALTLLGEVQQASWGEQARDVCGRRGVLERLLLLLSAWQAVALGLRQDVVARCGQADMRDAACEEPGFVKRDGDYGLRSASGLSLTSGICRV